MRSSIRGLGTFLGLMAERIDKQNQAVPVTTRTWVGAGTDDNWSTPANWLDNLVPTSDDAVVFQGTTRLTPCNNIVGMIVHNITFADGAGRFVLVGNPITLCADVVNLSTSPQIIDMMITIGNISAFSSVGNTIQTNGVISGAGTLMKNGPYALHVGGGNTYSGGTIILDGTLTTSIGNDTCLGTGDITINSATATLFLLCSLTNNIINNVFNGRLVLALQSGVTLSGNIEANATLNIVAAATNHTLSGTILGFDNIDMFYIGEEASITITSTNTVHRATP